MAIILSFAGKTPTIASSAFLAPNAVIIGNVTIGEDSSIWFGAVLRGDNPDREIRIGMRTSIQDNCVIHVGEWGPTLVGDDCTIGHGAVFESCTIGRSTVVGMNSVILQRASVGAECVVAAGAVVKEGAVFPDRTLIAGVPASVRKELTGSAAEWVAGGGQHYVDLSRRYIAQGIGRASLDTGFGGIPAGESE